MRACVSLCVSGIVALTACKSRPNRGDPPPPSAPVASAPPVPPPPVASSPAVVAPVVDAGPATLGEYLVAKVVSGKSIGHTSVVLKLKLEGGLTAAYKPASTRGPLRYKGEIAAYRLAMALGLANVPPVLPRSFSKEELERALGGKDTEAGALVAKEAIAAPDGDVAGALIPWLPHLDFLALEQDPLLSEWKGWLNGPAEPPPAKKRRAAEVSNLIVFDYITGNWDRWSGGNIGFDKERDRVLFIDNDGAFYDDPPKGPLDAQEARLKSVRRFSRSLVTRLRAMDMRAIAATMGIENGQPLLSEKALRGVVSRRDAALKIIDDRMAASGAPSTLVFE